MSKPHFNVYRIADMSTKYITREDGRLIGRQDAPGHVACVDSEDAQSGSPGDVFTILQESRLHRRQMADLKHFGFSSAFARIFRALYRQRIPYVRFDAGSGDAEGLPEFDW
jgi:hypothetical protein